MLKMEDWVTIRCLRAKGQSIKKIAKLLKISRNSVRRALRGDG
jgi:DNA-binding CsgD family transcriptional regulator